MEGQFPFFTTTFWSYITEITEKVYRYNFKRALMNEYPEITAQEAQMMQDNVHSAIQTFKDNFETLN